MQKTIAIITGATGGTGREFVKQLVDEVDEIWAIGRNMEKLGNLAQSNAEKIQIMSVDLSNIDNLSGLIKRLQEDKVTVKYLVNNAGTGRMAASVDFTPEEIQKHITTHDTAMAVLCNICIPYMEKSSHILNVASQSAFQPNPYINLYAASKAFCYSYSRALNVELQARQIAVTVVCPGWIRTDLLKEEMNGVKVEFPHLAEAKDVVCKAIRDAKRGKAVSVYSFYVKWMRLVVKIMPHRLVMKAWMRNIQKYLA